MYTQPLVASHAFRWTYLLCAMWLAFASVGCDNGIRVLNVAPSVTAVGPLEAVDGQITMTVWLYDYETDACDLELTLVRQSGSQILSDIGGDGSFGLTTSRDAYGRPHSLTFAAPTDLAVDEALQIRIIASDGDTGAPYLSAPFTLADGLAAP